MAPFLILAIVSVSTFNSNMVIGICAIVYVVTYFLFNIAKMANNFVILKMAYVLPIIIGGVMLYLSKENGIYNKN
jgi:succinate-acetate transporter protein